MIVFLQFRDKLMHTNTLWRSNILEILFVTPRFDHIHHSNNPDHFNRSLGSFFTFWDRLFGTYQNPDHVDIDNFEYGTGEKTKWWKLVIGI
jgi:sterol desaturase/sphingolipid hydroxylase (fatty acid hydroxylase superfamily)